MSDEDILIFLIKHSANKKVAIKYLVGFLLEDNSDGTKLLVKTHKTQALLCSEINRISNNDTVIGGFASLLAFLISLVNLFIGASNPGCLNIVPATIAAGVIVVVLLGVIRWFRRRPTKLEYAYCWLNLICESFEHDAGKLKLILREELNSAA
jgi:hypothetical protein